MKYCYANTCDDFQQIKSIQTKWRNQRKEIEKKSEMKKLQLTFTEEQNIEFQLPDVFITTKQFHKPIKSPNPKEKKQCFSFDLSVQSQFQSKHQRNLDIQTLETNYKKFKQIDCSLKSSPLQSPTNKTFAITQKQEFYKIDGINYPYNLYMLHRKRREKLGDIFRNSTCENSNQKIKEFEEENLAQIRKKQKENRQKEYVSRSFLDNAYFSILSTNKGCKNRIQKKIQQFFPKESRYHQDF